ncbi:MAG TPA: CDP-alcohol phosphatidyltransferase family protein [Ignavibacteriaceae bacterium]
MQKIFTFSNLLSTFRLFLAIPMWFLFNDLENSGTRYIILGIAFTGMVTDFLDGYFARKFNEVSELGKIIDPLADKVLIGVVVIKLFLIDKIPDYLFFMVIGRDILIFTGGLLLSAKIGKVLPSNMLGKLTVTILSLLLILIIMQVDESTLIYQLIYYITLVLIVVSFIAYLIRAFEFINRKSHGTV